MALSLIREKTLRSLTHQQHTFTQDFICPPPSGLKGEVQNRKEKNNGKGQNEVCESPQS